MCAPALPAPARVIVLPALLMAPGYALLRLLGQPADGPAVSVAVPASIVIIICAALVLDVSGIRLDPLSLGFVLGSVTILFLAGSYGRHLAAGRVGTHRRQTPLPIADQELVRRDITVDERR